MYLDTALCCLIYTIVLILLSFVVLILAGAWEYWRMCPKDEDIDKKMREIYKEEIELQDKIKKGYL